jgi:flagellar protein FliJ
MDPLATLLDQAEAQRNTALAAFNQALARRDAARTQLHDLDQYRSDYTQRWQQQFQRAAALEIVRAYHQFAERLTLALTQQERALGIAEQTLARANDTLTANELRVASVRKLIERRQADGRLRDERRDQRAQDEMAQRVVNNARRAAAEGASA